MKSRIGITTFIENRPIADYVVLSENYVHSTAAGGGLPVLIPRIEDANDYGAYLDGLDGLLLSGGGDVSPLRYAETISPAVRNFDSRRDEWEIGLFLAAYERRMPVLGICRGHQLVNVALGGSLVQDLPSERPETANHYPDTGRDEPCHHVDITEGSSRLFAAFGTPRILTNSFHHQAVKDLAPALAVTARTTDGVIEGFESIDRDRFLVGVQFHPECLTRRFPAFVRLFAALADAAAEYRRTTRDGGGGERRRPR